jgi:hypothetical protein
VPEETCGPRSTPRVLWLAFVVATVASAGILVHFHDRFWWPPDDGQYAHIAERMLHGEVHSREILDPHPGYVHFLHVAAFRIFGVDLVSLRYPLATAALLQAMIAFFILRREGVVVASFGSLASTAFGVIQFLNPTPNWYCLLIAVAVAAIFHWPRTVLFRAELVGFLVASSYLFRQLSGVITACGAVALLLLLDSDERSGPRSALVSRTVLSIITLGFGAYLAASTDLLGFALFGLWPLLLLWLGSRRARLSNRAALARIARMAAGALVAIAPLVLYHLAHHSLRPWLADTLGSALTVARFDYLRSSSYGTLITGGLDNMLRQRQLAIGVNGAYSIVLPCVGAITGAVAVWRFWRGGITALPPVTVLAVVYGVVSLFNQIPIYLYYSVGFSFVGLLAVTRGVTQWVATGLIGVLIPIGIWFHAGQSLNRGLGGTIAGTRIDLVPSGLERGSLQIDDGDRAVYVQLLSLIKGGTRSSEPIFVLPYGPELYFLSGRRNPFPFFVTKIDVTTADDEARVLDALSRLRPRFVFDVPSDKYHNAQSRAIVEWVKQRYEALGMVGRYSVYKIRTRGRRNGFRYRPWDGSPVRLRRPGRRLSPPRATVCS